MNLKTIPMKSFFIALLLSALFVSAGRTQNYSIGWFTIDSGGTSTGSVYSVSGTIGQPDAGSAMANGNYSLTGGFWSLFTVQTEGAPLLTISRTNNAVMISWLSSSTNWTLQQNTSLNSTNWVIASETVTDNGTLKFIVVNPPTGNRFYRLSWSLPAVLPAKEL